MVGVVFIVRGLHMWLQRTHCRPSIRIFAITPRLFGERDEIGVLSFDRLKSASVGVIVVASVAPPMVPVMPSRNRRRSAVA